MAWPVGTELDQPHYLHAHGRSLDGHQVDADQAERFAALREQTVEGSAETMWWPRRQHAEPGTGREETGRVYDFDTVRPEGHQRWADLLPLADALAEPAQLLPTVGPERRGRGGAR